MGSTRSSGMTERKATTQEPITAEELNDIAIEQLAEPSVELTMPSAN